MKFIIELYDEIRYKGLIEYILFKKKFLNISYEILRIELISYSMPRIYRDPFIKHRLDILT